MSKSIALAILAFALSHQLSGAVDCGNPRNRQERVVCANPELLNLDRQLASEYQKALAGKSAVERPQLEMDQRSWEESSGGCWDRVDCIKKRYTDRIAFLQGTGLTAAQQAQAQAIAEAKRQADQPPIMRPAEAAQARIAESQRQQQQQQQAQQQQAQQQAEVRAEVGEAPSTSEVNPPPPSNPQPQEQPSSAQQQAPDTSSVPSEPSPQQPVATGGSEPVHPSQSAKSASAAQAATFDTNDIEHFVLMAVLGLLPAFIARKKGRTFWKWWIYSFFLFPIALVHVLLVGHTSTLAKYASELGRGFSQGVSQSNQPASSAEAPFQVLSPTDEEGIRQRLRQYSEYGKMECVHCGYTGHMGIVKRKKPLHENGLFKFLAFAGGRVERNAYVASAFMGGVAKIILQCPACGSLWEKQTGDRPSMFMIGR